MKLEAKALEIRDEGTCIAAVAIRMLAEPSDPAQEWLIHSRSGYPRDGSGIVLMHLGDQLANVDPYSWPRRTMGNAHHYIYNNFDALVDGQVVDVRVLLGEATEAVASDRFAE